MVCRTQNGDRIDLTEAACAALWAHIRRVVRDASGAVIDLGRRRRLFTGSAREAGTLLDDRCIWPGCDRPDRICQADHSLGWRGHGASVPRNCGPLCGRHNRLKDRGQFTTRRNGPDDWSVTLWIFWTSTATTERRVLALRRPWPVGRRRALVRTGSTC